MAEVEVPSAPPMVADGADKSEFDLGADAGAYTHSQTVEAGSFAVFIGGKRLPGSQIAAGVLLLLILVIVAVAAAASGSNPPPSYSTAPAPVPAGYQATFTSLQDSGVCRSEADMGVSFVGYYPFDNGVLPDTCTLNGNAWLDDNFGVTFDGEDDSVCLGEHSAEGWAEDGDFSISFSFTKRVCAIPGQYEFLFSAFEDCEQCSVARGQNAGIHIFLGCENSDESASFSTINTQARGHSVIRIVMTDDDGKRASMDIDVDLGQAQTKTATAWTHFILAVSRNSIKAFIDGSKVGNNQIGYAINDRYFGWATHAENLALGDPENLARGGLGKISLSGCAYIGGGKPGTWASGNGYAGSFAGVQLLAGTLKSEDAACLYQMSTAHAGLCPAFSAIFTGTGSGGRGGADAPLCAGEGQTCQCSGQVRYGTSEPDRNGNTGGRWSEWRTVQGSIACSNAIFGDPARGSPKSCVCQPIDPSGLAGAADGLAYAQRPNRMSTQAILSQSSARAMDGPAEVLPNPTRDTSISSCASICGSSGTGYPFMGLQGIDQCFCGSVYNKRDGMPQLDDSECDIDGQPGPDCGMGLDMRADGSANPQGCVWKNAVYAISTQTYTDRLGIDQIAAGTPESPVFIGCFADSEGQYGEDMTLGGNTFVDQGYGLTFDGEGDYAVINSPAAGNYADGGAFTVAFYFTQTACDIPGSWETLYAHRGIDQPLNDLYLHDGRYSNSNVQLQNIVEIYLGCSDRIQSTIDGKIIRVLLADAAGTKATFDVPAAVEMTGGYVTDSWVHIALSVSSNKITTCVDGRQVDQFGFSPPSYETDWAQTDANVAYPDPSHLTAPFGPFALSGGSDGPILGALATSGDWRSRPFAGSITFVTLWTKWLSQDEVECLFQWQNTHIAVCRDEGPYGKAWEGNMVDGTMPDNTLLKNDAFIDGNGFGVTFDGSDDFMAISPAPRGLTDRDFSISFWFTRTQCTVPGGDEYLYSQRQSWAGSRGRRGSTDDQGATIDLAIACRDGRDTTISTRSVAGAVIRVVLRDNAGKQATFDVPLSTELTGGYVDDYWAHFILSVTSTGIRTFVDGLEVSWSRYGFRDDDKDPQRNLAYPNPTQFQGSNRLGSFSMNLAESFPAPYGSEEAPAAGLAYGGCWAVDLAWRDSDQLDPLFEQTVRWRTNNTLYDCAVWCDSQGLPKVYIQRDRCSCGSQDPATTARNPPPPPGRFQNTADLVDIGNFARAKLDEASCTDRCSQDGADYACGNYNAASVYTITDIGAAAAAQASSCDWFKPVGVYRGQGLNYLGCFSDDHDWTGGGGFYSQPVFPDGTVGFHGPMRLPPPPPPTRGGGEGRPSTEGLYVNRDNTVEPMYIELCASLCTTRSAQVPTPFRYMAIFDGSECFCSNTAPPQAQRDAESACNDPCPGDVTQLCGDGGRSRHSQVYEITGEPIPANGCSGDQPPSAIIIGGQAGMTGFGNGGGFAGSVADIQLFRNGLTQDDADCLYRSGGDTVAICQPANEMWGLHYFQSFMPAVPDLDFALRGWGENLWNARGTPEALAECVTECQRRDRPGGPTMYAGLEWFACSCGNSYGSAGSAPDSECGVGDNPLDPAAPTCGMVPMEMEDVRASMNNGVSNFPPCVGKNAVYQIGRRIGNRIVNQDPTYVSCARMGMFRPPGVTLYGNSFFDDSTRATGSAGSWSQNIIGTADGGGLNDGGRDYGIHFDGEGDYAEIVGNDAGYAADGSFTVSMWATRPDCNIFGRQEWIYSHTQPDPTTGLGLSPASNDPSDNVLAGIALAYICTENGEHTTIPPLPPSQSGRRNPLHLVRVYLNDDDGTTAQFDIPLNSAAQRGGSVTREWVHLAVSVGVGTNRTGVEVYIDGKLVPDSILGVPPQHDLSGGRFTGCRRLADGTEDPTCDVPAIQRGIGTEQAETTCMSLCTGFDLFALTYSRTCYCGNSADRWNPLMAPDQSSCDNDGDNVPDCGKGVSGTCRGFEAVYNNRGVYQGCYIDQGSGAQTFTLADNAAWVPDSSLAGGHAGLSNMGLSTFSVDLAVDVLDPSTGIQYEGCVGWDDPPRDFLSAMPRDGSMTPDMCASMCQNDADALIAHTHFALGRRGQCFCGDTMTTAPLVDTNLCNAGCVGDATLKCGGQRRPGDYYTIYSYVRGMTVQTIQHPYGTPNPIFLGGHSWPGYRQDLSGGFVGNIADLAIFDRTLSEKEMDCLFRETERGLGSCDPYSIRVSMNEYLGVGTGAPSLGRDGIYGEQVEAQVPGETPGTVVVGRQRAAVQLIPNPWGTDYTTTDDDVLSGAHKVEQNLVLCSYLSASDTTVCASRDEMESGDTVPVPNLPAMARIDAVPSFAAEGAGYGRGGFAFGFWFEKDFCNRTADLQMPAQEGTLFSWSGADMNAPLEDGSMREGSAASIRIQLICAGNYFAPSTVGGHVLRFTLVDDDGVMYSADVSTNAEADDGRVVDRWVNLLVQVDQRAGVDIFIDNVQARYSDFRGNVTHLMGWQTSLQSARTNAAFPDPADARLGTFNNLDSSFYLGGSPDQVPSPVSQYVGSMEAFQGFSRPLSDDDRRCLYKTGLVRRG